MEQGTVASLISLCMAPPLISHPGSPTSGSPRQRSSSVSSINDGSSSSSGGGGGGGGDTR